MDPAGLRLVLPGNVRHNSGGNAYNAALLRAVADLGVAAEAREVDGDWPVGSPEDRQRFGRLLADADGGRVTLVDGLVAAEPRMSWKRRPTPGCPPGSCSTCLSARTRRWNAVPCRQRPG